VAPENTDGTFSGLLQTKQISVVCCDLRLLVAAQIGAGFGVQGTLSDPLSLILPAGWNYTLSPAPVDLSAYDQFAGVPEPSTALLLTAGLTILSGKRRRRVNE
jgi:hypothetical protein